MEGIIDGLSAALSTGSLTVGGLVSSDESASFAFAGGQHEGLVHIRIEGDQPRTATMLSCFWNQREARLCKRLCQETIGQAATDSGDATEPTGVTQP